MRYGCPQCRDEVPTRADELSLARARRAAHLDACPSCRAFASSYAAAIELARAWPPAPTEATKEAILDRVGARTEPPRRRAAPRGLLATLSVAGVAAALLVLALARSGREPTPPPAGGKASREGAAPLAASAARGGEARTAAPAPTGVPPADELGPPVSPRARTDGRGPTVRHGSRHGGTARAPRTRCCEGPPRRPPPRQARLRCPPRRSTQGRSTRTPSARWEKGVPPRRRASSRS